MAVKEKSNHYKVAEWAGNSPKIIKSDYLKSVGLAKTKTKVLKSIPYG